MARAYFDQNPFGAAPIEQGLDTIRRTYSMKAPSPMDNLSKAIEQPFVENVIIPGISRIRDEMRLSEQEDLIAEKAAAARAQGAQLMQQAAAREQQGLDAEIAAAVSGVNVPRAAGLATLPGPNRVRPGDARQALSELKGFVSEARAAGRDPARMVDEGGAWPRRMALLREAGLADVAIEVLYGSDKPIGMAIGQLQQTQQRRGEQEATTAATQRFERALAGELPQVAAAEGAAAQQALTPMMVNGRPGVRTRGYEGDREQGRIDAIATREYRRALEGGKSREESVAIGLAAAKAAQPEAVAAQAAQPQAIQQPQLIEQANRLRQQATDMEREAKGIEETPVYRTFGDHAMPFLDALDSGDVAKQMALMESVGGSTDYQPFGKGAMGKAMGKDASMRARRDLLDLKKNYLKAKRREDTGLKLIAARKPAPKAKKTGGGGGYGKRDDVLLRVMNAFVRGDEMTPADKRDLANIGLGNEEIDALKTGKEGRQTWHTLIRKMSSRARAKARDMLTDFSTPKDAEKANIRKLEGDAKRLREEAKATDNKVEKKRLEDRADAKEQRAADARIEAAELLAEAATQREERLASAAQRKADRDAGAAKRAEVVAVRKEIADLQKDLNAVDVNIAAGGTGDDPEKWAKMKIALEAKIAALRRKLPAKAN